MKPHPGRPIARQISVDLGQSLKNFSAYFIVPFGVWIDKNDVPVGYGKLNDYDMETFKSNLATIDQVMKDTVGTLKGTLFGGLK